jgi:hypothetical protein
MNLTVDTTSGVGYRQSTSQSFPESYFYEELGRFRETIGDSRFWEKDEEKREAFISGLTFVYLNTVPNDNSKITQTHIDTWGMHFRQALDEYNRRGTLIIMQLATESRHPLLQGRPDCPECGRPHGVAKSTKDGQWYCYVVSHPTPRLITIEEKIAQKIKKTVDEGQLSDIVLT